MKQKIKLTTDYGSVRLRLLTTSTPWLIIAMLFFNFCHLNARSKFKEQITFHDDLHYSSPASKDNSFDVYLPKTAAAPTPAVVFVHGGYWRNQARSYYRAFTGLYENFGLALASRGIATAVIDYRLFPHAKPAEQIADVKAAVAFLKAHATEYNIDPNAIVVMGHSAGGHLALMAAWQNRNTDIRAVVALSPILDIAHMRQNKEADFNQELTVPFFGNGEQDGEFSPATYASAKTQAALLLFGENDYAYLIEQSRLYREKFGAANLKHVMVESVPGVDHSSIVMDVNSKADKVSERVASYIKKIIEQR